MRRGLWNMGGGAGPAHKYFPAAHPGYLKTA